MLAVGCSTLTACSFWANTRRWVGSRVHTVEIPPNRGAATSARRLLLLRSWRVEGWGVGSALPMQAASDGACFLVSSRAVQVWPLWACGCWDAYGAAPSSRIPLQTGQASGHTKVLTGQLLASCPSDLMVSGSSLSLWFLVPCACRYPSPEGPAIALYPAAHPSCHSFLHHHRFYTLRSSFLIQSFLLFLFRELFSISCLCRIESLSGPSFWLLHITFADNQ